PNHFLPIISEDSLETREKINHNKLSTQLMRVSEAKIQLSEPQSLVVIDEIGYTPIEKREANLFFNLISEMYEKLSIVITSNKSFENWAEMMGDSVMTTALLDRLLHHARIFNLDGESYRIKNKKRRHSHF
ncbi:MAG: ATP-binding protein, partial [Candidatus Aerophobetes bacterium]|nr:ATP-binding protein [Candidatus Aerophobetes bacterium]